MKLTDYLAQELAKEVKHIFVGNGGVVIHILDSLNKARGITLVPMQTEQGAAIAAESYARVAGFGIAVATSGPGFINLSQGIACAYYDSIPTLFIVGGVPKGHIKKSEELRQFGFQEMEVTKIVSSFTKVAITLNSAKDIKNVLSWLIWKAKEGRPGPVLLEIPDDVQREEVNPEGLLDTTHSSSLPILASQVEEMKQWLSRCNRPLIIIGSGAKGAEREIRVLLNRILIPYMLTWATKDMIPEPNHQNLVPCAGVSSSRVGNMVMQDADLIIALGARLDSHQIGSNFSMFNPMAKKIVIDVDKAELDKYKYLKLSVLKVNCDVKRFIRVLGTISGLTRKRKWVEWKAKCLEWKKKYPTVRKESPYDFFENLSQELKTGDIVITDAGATLTWTMQGLRILKPGIRLFSAFNHSPMGYALPAAIGAKFASPSSRVFCITGDGGMQMNIQELATIKYWALPMHIIVIDNQGYGIIRQTQDTWLEGRHTCAGPNSGLGIPNFETVAEAYGVNVSVIRIRDDAQIKPKLKWGERLENIF